MSGLNRCKSQMNIILEQSILEKILNWKLTRRNEIYYLLFIFHFDKNDLSLNHFISFYSSFIYSTFLELNQKWIFFMLLFFMFLSTKVFGLMSNTENRKQKKIRKENFSCPKDDGLASVWMAKDHVKSILRLCTSSYWHEMFYFSFFLLFFHLYLNFVHLTFTFYSPFRFFRYGNFTQNEIYFFFFLFLGLSKLKSYKPDVIIWSSLSTTTKNEKHCIRKEKKSKIANNFLALIGLITRHFNNLYVKKNKEKNTYCDILQWKKINILNRKENNQKNQTMT